MNFEKAIETCSTNTELKRIASAYVIDHRALTEEELRAALLKTKPQYCFPANVAKAINGLFYAEDRDSRILAPAILVEVLLQADSYMLGKREVEDAVISWEQGVVDRANEDIIKRIPNRRQDLEFFQFVLEVAWEHNDTISVDEKNLLDKIRARLKITDTEFRILEAKLGHFPTNGNALHQRGQIEEIRRRMQQAGLVFPIRDADGTDFDLIPEELAATIRNVLGIQIKRRGYREMLRHRCVRSKPYLQETLTKVGVAFDKYAGMEELSELVIEHVPPTVLLGGLSPKDGLDMELLRKWCAERQLPTSGPKSDVIDKIVAQYDAILLHSDKVEDSREHYYRHFDRLAWRDSQFLRTQQLIEKDIEIERQFEEATNFLFERCMGHKPLALVGSARPDGALSYRDKLIYWDNKSKESPVHLPEHMKQFDGYIAASEKEVAGFLVIGPDFTEESKVAALQYQVEKGIALTLIRAAELKQLAEAWHKRAADSEGPFPLGYLLQQGRFNLELLSGLVPIE